MNRVRLKTTKTMKVASIKPRSHVAGLHVGASPSRRSRDLGMLDTLSYFLALGSDKERQGCRQSSRPPALSGQRKQTPSQVIAAIPSTAKLSYTSASQFTSVRCGAEHSEPNKRIKQRTLRVLDRARATHLRGGLCAAFGIKTLKPMHVANIKSRNRIASSLHGAMLSAQSRDFGMLDTSSCALALTGDKEHRGCRRFSSLVAFSSQENPETNSNHRSNFKHGCVGVHFSVAVLFRLAAKQYIRSRTSASSPHALRARPRKSYALARRLMRSVGDFKPENKER